MENNYLVILALLTTSIIVRVLPSIVRIRFSPNSQILIEDVLPVTIFICFITYIVMSEMVQEPYSAGLAFISIFVMSIVLRQGLVLTAVCSSVIYYALV
jgi:hypothetical protein|tara:strand:+ start:3592 stop:3888 length:297 start_codon:yes stop_codon:yes gene_type:complete